jgi:fatty acid desaturase
MNATTLSTSNLMREKEGTLPNLLALGYALFGYAGGFALLICQPWYLNLLGVPLLMHSMVIGAYLIHEAAHYTLFRDRNHNRLAGELMGWITGASYASFERIRHMHIRHHRDRADLAMYDYKTLLGASPRWLNRLVYALEWAYVPAIEIIMHAQVILRPLFDARLRAYRTRVIGMLAARGLCFGLLGWYSPKVLLLYVAAYLLFMTVMHFFDAFHHTFEQHFVANELDPLSLEGKDRSYEQANTYSNLVSHRFPLLNLLTLNFGYHNAHHERAATPWYRLPILHRELYGDACLRLLPLRELLGTFHRNRLRRILDDDYGQVGDGADRANSFVGAHGVSFLTVV